MLVQMLQDATIKAIENRPLTTIVPICYYRLIHLYAFVMFAYSLRLEQAQHVQMTLANLWDRSRRENRVPNGTLTLRRTSTTPHGTTMSQVSNADSIARIDSSSGSQSQQPFTQIPESDAPLRYSKESMYDIWQHLQQSDALNPASLDRIRDVGIDNSTVTANGYSGRWGKTSDSTRDYNLAADVCWNQAGHNEILNMEEPRGSEATVRCATLPSESLLTLT